MGLDWNALEKLSKEVEKDAKGASGSIIAEWAILKAGEEVAIKLLPPTDGMNGSFFQKKMTYKIGGKYCTSKASFGDSCIIAETIADFGNLNDPDVDKLMDNWKVFSRRPQVTYLLPALLLKADGDTYTVNEPIILELKPDTLQAILLIVSNPKMRRKCGNDDSIMSRERGYPVILTPKGKKKLLVTNDIEPFDTSGEEFEKYYEKPPNVLRFIYAQMKSDAHLESIVANFFDEEDIIDDDGSTKKEYLDRLAAIIEAAAPEGEEEEKEEEDTPPVKKRKTTRRVKKVLEGKTLPDTKGKTRNLMDDVENLDD